MGPRARAEDSPRILLPSFFSTEPNNEKKSQTSFPSSIYIYIYCSLIIGFIMILSFSPRACSRGHHLAREGDREGDQRERRRKERKVEREREGEGAVSR